MMKMLSRDLPSIGPAAAGSNGLAQVHAAIVSCERCPRLRSYCRRVAQEKKRAHLSDTYWGRPVPGFGDPDALDCPDLSHSEKQSRFLRLGPALTGLVLMVAYTVRRRDDGESIRIIGARRAGRKERAAYTAAGD